MIMYTAWKTQNTFDKILLMFIIMAKLSVYHFYNCQQASISVLGFCISEATILLERSLKL